MHLLKYVTHNGVEINLLQNGIRTRNLDDLFQSFYDAVEKNGRISHFKTKVHTMNVQVDFLNWKGISWKAKYDALVDAIDSDVRAKKHGTLHFDDYKLKCFMYASKPSAVNFKSFYMQCDLSIVTDQKAWFKEESKSFVSSSGESGRTKRYAYRYPFRYQAKKGTVELYNNFPHEARFKMRFYGPASNPSVQIGNVNYQIYTELLTNEYVEIDSINRTIVKNNSQNLFNSRNKDFNIFTSIPVGKNQLTWDGAFNFDIVLYEERSQPKWTSLSQNQR